MKLSRIALGVLFCLFPVLADAAGWARTYGGRGTEQSPVFAQKPDGGLVAASSGPISTDKFDSWVISLSPDGDILWQKRYERSADQELFDIQKTRDGGYVFTGLTTTTSAGDVFLVKLDANGGIEWQRMYEAGTSDRGHAITQTSDGGYVIAGTSSAMPPVIAGNGFLIKTDDTGNILWQKTYKQGSAGAFVSVQETPGGGFIAVGGGSPYVVVMRLDTEGNILWQKGYSNYVEGPSLIKLTADGGYIVVGHAFASPLEDWAFVMKLDVDGNIQWQRFIGTDFLNEGLGNVLETADGYLISGSVRLAFNRYGSSDDDAWLVNLDKNGNLLWQKLYGAPPFADGFGYVFHAGDGGFIAAGATSSFGAGKSDVFVVKLDANGDLPGCSLVRPSSVVLSDLALRPVTTSFTAAPGAFTKRDPGLVAVDTSYSPGNLCIEGTMPLPAGQSSFSYPTDLSPSLSTNPVQAKPLALGHIAESHLAPLSLRIGVLPFTGPVDTYLAVYAPVVSPEIWMVTPENKLQPLSQGLVKWKGGVTEKISESVVEFLDTKSFPSGDYHFFLGLTSAGNLDDFYLWDTSFNKP